MAGAKEISVDAAELDFHIFTAFSLLKKDQQNATEGFSTTRFPFITNWLCTVASHGAVPYLCSNVGQVAFDRKNCFPIVTFLQVLPSLSFPWACYPMAM